MDKDQPKVDVKELGLVYYGGAHEQLRYFTHYKVLPGKEGHDSLEITFLDGTTGIIEADFIKGKRGEESRWYEAREAVRRYPNEEI